jgi:hypothetical protein
VPRRSTALSLTVSLRPPGSGSFSLSCTLRPPGAH